MLECELVPVTLNNLDQVSQLTKEFDFPRTENWIRRALFNPYAAPCGPDARRGYMLKSRDDGYVGVLCYSPTKLYLDDRPIIGYSGLLLGVRKKYGEWLMDLFSAVQKDELGHLAFGNTSCSAHATKICRLVRGDKNGPNECCYSRISHLGLPSYLLACFRHTPLSRFQKSIWRILAPLGKMQYCVSRLAFRSKFSISAMDSFTTEDFSVFWKRYLPSNKGLVASREPAILNHLFADALKLGRLVLIAARDDAGIVGYILLRKYQMYDIDGVIKYKIIDAVAVDNDTTCLRDLVRYAKIYAIGHSGERIEYIGGNPNLSEWLDCELPCKTDFGFSTTTYFYSGDDASLIDAVENRKGWFFGPFDGERCLGHLGFIDC